MFIPLVKSMLRTDFQIAAQNCWKGKGGAFTGEIRYHWQCCLSLSPSCLSHMPLSLSIYVLENLLYWTFARLSTCSFSSIMYCHNLRLCSCFSAEMLANLHVPWVILGHSERRSLCGETDAVSGVLLGLAQHFSIACSRL